MRLRTSQEVVAGALLSASDTSAPSTNVTLSLNSGVPYFEARQDGRYLVRLSASRSVADGQEHTVALVTSNSRTSLYVDGVRVASTTDTALFGLISGLDGMWAGRNVDSGGPQWHYAGHLRRVAVFGGS